MPNRRILAALALAMCWPLAGHAQQIFKCPDAQGRMQYTDQPCAGALHRNRVRISENVLDGSYDRQQVQRWRQERAAQAPQAESLPLQDGSRHSWACQNAMRNLSITSTQDSPRTKDAWQRQRAPLPGMVSSKHERESREKDAVAKHCNVDRASLDPRPAPRRRTDQSPPAPPPTPSVITHCAGDVCFDNLGGVYPPAGGGNHIGPKGQFCTRTGNMLHCH